MALVKGTNCGFVTVAPTEDPAGTNTEIDARAYGFKDIAPVGTNTVTEIGFWCDEATEESNFEVGIYSDSSGVRPLNVVGSLSQTNAKGTDAGWKVVTGLNIPITAGTTYWIAIQLDDTLTTTNLNYDLDAGSIGRYKTSQTTLIDPWGTTDNYGNANYSIYAVTNTPSSAPITTETVSLGGGWMESENKIKSPEIIQNLITEKTRQDELDLKAHLTNSEINWGNS